MPCLDQGRYVLVAITAAGHALKRRKVRTRAEYEKTRAVLERELAETDPLPPTLALLR